MEVDNLQIKHFGIEVPFMNHIGLQSINLEGNCCRTHLQLNRSLVNSRGDIHGGGIDERPGFHTKRCGTCTRLGQCWSGNN